MTVSEAKGTSLTHKHPNSVPVEMSLVFGLLTGPPKSASSVFQRVSSESREEMLRKLGKGDKPWHREGLDDAAHNPKIRLQASLGLHPPNTNPHVFGSQKCP